MRLPVIRGVIDRRILVNFRIDPSVLARVVPEPFRPQLIAGYGMAGICLIRLRDVRPRWLPAWLGIGSENAAHRMAVEWDEQAVTRHGVYIPRRDSSSWLNALAGGQIFPGIHHHSRFSVAETADQLSVEVSNADGTHVAVEGRVASELPASSIFRSLPQTSDFFHCGSIGYSPTRESRSCLPGVTISNQRQPNESRGIRYAGTFEGLELCTSNWDMVPLAISRAESSFFADPSIFPAGSVEFDCALLMLNIAHEWHGLATMTASMPAPCVEPA